MVLLIQIRMVLYKNWLLKRRSLFASLCEILVPLIVIGVLVFGFSLSEFKTVDANNYIEIVRFTGPEANVTININNALNQSAIAPSINDLILNLTNSQTVDQLSQDPEWALELAGALFQKTLQSLLPAEPARPAPCYCHHPTLNYHRRLVPPSLPFHHPLGTTILLPTTHPALPPRYKTGGRHQLRRCYPGCRQHQHPGSYAGGGGRRVRSDRHLPDHCC